MEQNAGDTDIAHCRYCDVSEILPNRIKHRLTMLSLQIVTEPEITVGHWTFSDQSIGCPDILKFGRHFVQAKIFILKYSHILHYFV